MTSAGGPKRLLVIRHAKAAPGSPDMTRPLTERGRRDARALGRWLRERDVVPDLVVVSPATRTVQTWEEVAAGLGADVPVVRDVRVWRNDEDELVALVTEQDETVSTLAVVGHNPSMHAFAAGLGADVADFPTCTLALLTLDEWPRLETASEIEVVTVRG